jgi:hypothetical protein
MLVLGLGSSPASHRKLKEEEEEEEEEEDAQLYHHATGLDVQSFLYARTRSPPCLPLEKTQNKRCKIWS